MPPEELHLTIDADNTVVTCRVTHVKPARNLTLTLLDGAMEMDGEVKSLKNVDNVTYSVSLQSNISLPRYWLKYVS